MFEQLAKRERTKTNHLQLRLPFIIIFNFYSKQLQKDKSVETLL